MIELRVATSDTDLDAWRQVRRALLPNEKTSTVEELRGMLETDPERVFLLAELDGRVAGSGTATRSELGFGHLLPRVLPWARRRGVGTALAQALADHLVVLGFDTGSTNLEESEALGFAERFGYREVDRQVEQVRAIGDEPPPGPPPAGVEIVAVSERPELWTAAYDPLALQAFADMALDRPPVVPLERWQREWMDWPEATFVALAGGEVIGCAGLQRDPDHPERAENALTAVRRDWRGRGVAKALKLVTLRAAALHGLREVYTWTQRGNADMRALNERLGYVTRDECIMVRGPLPLPR